MNAIYKSETGGRQILRQYRELLADWPVPAEHVRVPTREGETFVVVSGPPDAPPVVLLHGSGGNAAAWRQEVAAWDGRFRAYAVDLIGEPGLSAPARPPLGSDRLALWLDDVLDALGLDAPAFVGTSLGGWVALDYAIRRPERVRRLALQCPAGLGRQTMGWLLRSMLVRPFGAWGMRRSVSIATGLRSAEVEPVIDYLTVTFRQFRPRTERLPLFPAEALAGLGMPVLVIVGERDAMIDSAGTVRRVRACVPDATVTVIPEAGHAIFGQAEPIAAFLA